MNIALLLHSTYALESVQFVARDLVGHLSGRYELRYLSPEYSFAVPGRQRRLADELVAGCDLLVGFHSTLLPLLEARSRAGRRVPCLLYLLGALPRGATTLRPLVPHLTTGDILVANCRADVELARLLFRNCRVELVPFAYDSGRFFPISAENRRAARGRLRLTEEDRVVLYAGRITLEKNLQTVLRAFAALVRQHRNAHLLIAGRFGDDPFREIGVAAANLRGLLARAAGSLGIPPDRVRVLRPADPSQLRQLYNVADVLVNLTLNHDENFGLAQVEAMACGTPVVGARWGGLNDTILDGETGYTVRTRATPCGVKADWWEAANRIATLIVNGSAREEMGSRAVIRAKLNYGPGAYRDRLRQLIEIASSGSCRPEEPLEPTAFARELWEHHGGGYSPYAPGTRAFELYRTLLHPYTGATSALSSGEEGRDHDLLVLSWPVMEHAGRLQVDDPMYPLAVEIPASVRCEVASLLGVLRARPVVPIRRLGGIARTDSHARRSAIDWLVESGIACRASGSAVLAPDGIDERHSRVVFTDHRVPITPPALLTY